MKSFGTVLLSILGAFLIIEVSAKVYFSQKSISQYGIIYEEHQRTVGDSGTGGFSPIAHPFFGFIANPATGVNNMGFHATQDFPYQKQKDEFVVGVFGGSVAHGIYQILRETEIFEDYISEHNPELRGKRIVFLNFAMGCMKQPQQAAIYSLLHSTLDFSINIDGLNEIVFASNHPTLEYPCWSEALYSEDFDLAAVKQSATRARKFQARIRDRLLALPQIVRESSTVFLMWKVLEKFTQKKLGVLNAQMISFQSKSRASTIPDTRDTQNWATATENQIAIAEWNRKPAIFVVQPNLWVEGSKTLSQEEQKFIQSEPRWDEKQGHITSHYKKLSEHVSRIQKRYPGIHDLSFAFKNNVETFYIDNCCHINREGNVILVQKIAEYSSRALKKAQ